MNIIKQFYLPVRQTIITIIVCIAVVAGVSLVSAWTGPTVNPPGGNVPAPINVGGIGQQKTGTLRVGGFTSDFGTYLATLGGNVGIGTASPAQKLDVVGNVRATDVCTTAGKCLSAAGGVTLAETTVSCSDTQVGPNADCSVTCPGGYVRSGCSSRHFTFYNAGMRILDGAYSIGNGCNCKTTGSGWPDPDQVGVVCIAYCLKAQ